MSRVLTDEPRWVEVDRSFLHNLLQNKKLCSYSDRLTSNFGNHNFVHYCSWLIFLRWILHQGKLFYIFYLHYVTDIMYLIIPAGLLRGTVPRKGCISYWAGEFQLHLRLRPLHRSSLHPFGAVYWVPEQLNIKAVTGACKLIDGCSLELCLAPVSVVSAGICNRNKVNSIYFKTVGYVRLIKIPENIIQLLNDFAVYQCYYRELERNTNENDYNIVLPNEN